MFSTTFQKYKENPIPPNIKLPKHKKYKPASLFFPTFVPQKPSIMENEIQTAPETQTEVADCEATVTTKCLNCGTEFEGNYCPECGQKADTRRFTMRFIFQNLLTAILSNDGGVWFSLKNLFTRPGAMIVEILDGKRKRYFSPFPMLFLALTVYILLFSLTGSRNSYNELENEMTHKKESVEVETELNDSNRGIVYGEKIRRLIGNGLKVYNNHYTAVYMLTLPLFAIATRAAYGRKNRKRYNWAEYLVAITYSMVMVVLYRCLTSLMFLVSESVSDRMGTLMPLVITIAFTACFRKMLGFGIAKTAWRSILTVLLYYAVLGLIFAAGIAILAFIIVRKYY